ncbi:hypothetical protein J31TS4_28390 [Paenibacillus sp. J31TS4]|uniref:ComEA family DNA-binding protein n=1 Tax=Paenibacillus sp. J31TS4 TaxID=2807195 RepID=UPI001B2AE077|nr:helix-hairpin-helix domain-containing protein [Paenibacillus sp. J31TS4]GIP39559.1 hypothetical protein J31TS4_28390 [Paenibacillus sp. J31TS4]
MKDWLDGRLAPRLLLLAALAAAAILGYRLWGGTGQEPLMTAGVRPVNDAVASALQQDRSPAGGTANTGQGAGGPGTGEEAAAAGGVQGADGAAGASAASAADRPEASGAPAASPGADAAGAGSGTPGPGAAAGSAPAPGGAPAGGAGGTQAQAAGDAGVGGTQAKAAGDAAAKPAAPAARAPAGKQIDLNTATLAQLMTLKGIGESKARAILDYRKQAGAFRSAEELMNVKGIGQKTFDTLKDKITVTSPR